MIGHSFTRVVISFSPSQILLLVLLLLGKVRRLVGGWARAVMLRKSAGGRGLEQKNVIQYRVPSKSGQLRTPDVYFS